MKPGTEQLESIPPVEQAVAEAAEATPRKPSRVKRAIARVRRSRWLRLGIALAVIGVVLFGLAYGVLRVLGPKEKFAPLDLPYVQHFADMDPRKWFISDGVWSLRQEMLAQAANLNKPADIYIPGQIVKEQPYHLSTYITFTKSTQEAGVNFNAQYPKMTTQQHQVFVARRSEDAGSDSATAADAPAMELVAGYTDENGEFVRQVTVPFDIDSDDNALAETTNGLYKTECVYGPDAPRPWADVDELELATLSWVHWFNEDRLHSHCGDIPPAEFEAAFYAAQQPTPLGVGNQ